MRLASIIVLTLSLCALTPSASYAATVNVCVNLTDSGIAAGMDRTDFLSTVQGIYDAAGIGTADSNKVLFHDCTPPTPPPATVHRTVSFSSEAGDLYGSSDKGDGTATIFEGTFAAQFAILSERRQAMAESVAHEIGHTLCAVHDCHGTGKKRTSTGIAACDASTASIMSVGFCVRASTRAAGTRTLSATSTLQIESAVIELDADPSVNWAFPEVLFFKNSVKVLIGRTQLDPIEDGGETLLADDPLVTLEFSATGRTDLYEHGWLNSDEEFVAAFDTTVNPDQILQAEDGDVIHAALHGRTGTANEGQIFLAKDHATASAIGDTFGNIDSLDFISGTYSDAVFVHFDIAGDVVDVTFDARAWGLATGFRISPPTAYNRRGIYTPSTLSLFGGNGPQKGIGRIGPRDLSLSWSYSTYLLGYYSLSAEEGFTLPAYGFSSTAKGTASFSGYNALTYSLRVFNQKGSFFPSFLMAGSTYTGLANTSSPTLEPRTGLIRMKIGPNGFGGSVGIVTTGTYMGQRPASGLGNYNFYQALGVTAGVGSIGNTAYGALYGTRTHTSLMTMSGGPLQGSTIGFVTRAPFITGTVTALEPEGAFSTYITATGMDARCTHCGVATPISLVSPRLLHLYALSGGSVLGKSEAFASIARLDFTVYPEPSRSLLLAAGLLGLWALSRPPRR